MGVSERQQDSQRKDPFRRRITIKDDQHCLHSFMGLEQKKWSGPEWSGLTVLTKRTPVVLLALGTVSRGAAILDFVQITSSLPFFWSKNTKTLF